MRVLRMRMWPISSPEGAVTYGMREKDLMVPIEQAQEHFSKELKDAFISVTIIEMNEDSSAESICKAVDELDSVNESLESDMAILFHFIGHWLVKFKAGSDVFFAILGRAPFGADQVIEVLKQLNHHSKYKGQTIITFDQDGTAIAMRDGDIKILGKKIARAIESSTATGILPDRNQIPFSQKIDEIFKKG